MLSLPAVCISSLGVLFASPAWAAPAPAPVAQKLTIGVVGLHQESLTPQDQDRAIAKLVEAINAQGRFEARGIPGVAAAVRGREAVVLEEGLLRAARQDLANGRTAAAQANWDEARGWLTSAILDFERVMPGANTTQELWEAQVLMGSTWLQQETPDEAAAKLAFQNAVALAPMRPPDPAQFPPSVTDIYASVQADLADEALTLKITGSGRLWIDGSERNELPTDVGDLRPGIHYVVARGNGLQGSAKVELGRGAEPAPLALDMVPPTLGAAADSPAGRSQQIAGIYSALGKRSEGLNYLLVGGVEGGVLHLQFLDTARSVYSKPVDLPFVDDCDDEAVAAIPVLLPIIGQDGSFTATAPVPAPIGLGDDVALARMLTQPPAAPVPVPGPQPTGTVHRSKVPLILGIGAGVLVAGGATTAAILLSGGNEPTTPTGTVVVHF